MLVELWPFSHFKSQFPQSDSGPIYQWRIPLKSAFFHRMRIIICRRPQTSRYCYYYFLILIKPQDAGPAQSLLCFCGWSVRVWEMDHRCWNVTSLDVMRVHENSGTNAWDCVTNRSLSVSSQGIVVTMPVEASGRDAGIGWDALDMTTRHTGMEGPSGFSVLKAFQLFCLKVSISTLK